MTPRLDKLARRFRALLEDPPLELAQALEDLAPWIDEVVAIIDSCDDQQEQRALTVEIGQEIQRMHTPLMGMFFVHLISRRLGEREGERIARLEQRWVQ